MIMNILMNYLRSKKGQQWWMAALATIIIIIIGVIVYLYFFSDAFGGLTGTLGTIEKEAIGNAPK